MANRIVRSIFWLCGFTGLGYGLLIVATPSEEQVKHLRKELPGVEKDPKITYNQNKQFTDVLQAAAQSSKPLYRMTKEEIDKELKRQ